MSSLEFLVAFKSSFLKFLQTQSEARPLSDILHSHNSKSLKDGCNTYREQTFLHNRAEKCATYDSNKTFKSWHGDKMQKERTCHLMSESLPPEEPFFFRQ